MLNLVTLTKPLLNNFEDDRENLIQQCTDTEKRVHQNVENLRESEEATCRSENKEQNTVLVKYPLLFIIGAYYILVAVTLSGILKAKQKLGVTFNSDIARRHCFKKFSKCAGPQNQIHKSSHRFIVF